MTTGWIWSGCHLLNFCEKTNQLRFQLCPNGVKNWTQLDLKPLSTTAISLASAATVSVVSTITVSVVSAAAVSVVSATTISFVSATTVSFVSVVAYPLPIGSYI
jgi:hypothetical protein